MAPAAAADAAGGAWQVLRARLAGTAPRHGLDAGRFGTGPGGLADPRLLALLPAAPRAAAVLVGLHESAAAPPGILLTVRAAHLRQHAGQISFPGGGIEPSDASPAAAALREAHEEVGLEPSGVEVLGYLPDQYVLTGFRITPVVAMLPAGFTPRLQSEEVEASFLLPFSVLLDPAAERRGTRVIAGIEVESRDLQFGTHRIWGATAGMLFALRALALS